ncbi:MAG: GNAT family N-acetyltransferase [Blastocatellia bacterium]|nr:GNAT family N-acetyltransferase [Blastocatellia bacterium]
MIQILKFDSIDDIPPPLVEQVQQLLLAQWGDPDEPELSHPVIQSELHPVYFLVTEDRRVRSYTRTIWKQTAHLGDSFKLYGLGDVIADPQFRQHGFGGMVVEAASNHIRSDPQADAAFLITEPRLGKFYGRYGWEHIPELRVTNDEDELDDESEFSMMMFLSPKAQAARAKWCREPLHLTDDEW